MLDTLKSKLVHAVRMTRSVVKNLTTKRSSQWPAVEKGHLARNPTCAACGGKANLNVHHVMPFHLRPSLELNTANLITLCMAINHHCHLLLGHGDDFKAYNPHVRKDAQTVLEHPNTFNQVASMIKTTRRYEEQP